MNAIEAVALGKGFKNKLVLLGLDLAIPAGCIYGLLGSNGAGKTTLLRLAVGLLIPSEGEIRVLGTRMMDGSRADKQRVGYVGDQSILPGWMRIGDLLGFEARLRPDLDFTRLNYRLSARGLGNDLPISTLSKGQRRWLDFELALNGKPTVLILDEPFDGLDPVARAEAMEDLTAHASASGCTILMSSHVLQDLERLCDRIGILAGGRIAFETSLDELKESMLVASGDRELDRHRDQFTKAHLVGRRVDARGTTWLLKGLPPDRERELVGMGFQIARPSLDELGRQLIRCLDVTSA